MNYIIRAFNSKMLITEISTGKIVKEFNIPSGVFEKLKDRFYFPNLLTKYLK